VGLSGSEVDGVVARLPAWAGLVGSLLPWSRRAGKMAGRLGTEGRSHDHRSTKKGPGHVRRQHVTNMPWPGTPVKSGGQGTRRVLRSGTWFSRMVSVHAMRDFCGVRSILKGCGRHLLLASLLCSCAVLYPELATPLRRMPPGVAPLPPPPDDLVYLTIKGATIPKLTRDGRKWDSNGNGAPDPYAVVYVDDKELFRTSVQPDTFEPTWPEQQRMNYRIPHSAAVRIELWDDNAIVAHPICVQKVRELYDSMAYGEEVVDCSGGATVTLEVKPPRPRLGLGFFYEVRSAEVVVTRVIAASAAGRARMEPGDRLLSIQGRPAAAMSSAEVQSTINSNADLGVQLELRRGDGRTDHVTLRDEALYPVAGEGIPVR